MRILALLLLLPLPAFADTCTDSENQAEMNLCAQKNATAADGKLNDAYKDAIDEMKQVDASLPADQRGAEQALRAAQRAWITYRDQTCAAEAFEYQGGSMQPMILSDCLARVSEDRAEELTSMAQGGG